MNFSLRGNGATLVLLDFSILVGFLTTQDFFGILFNSTKDFALQFLHRAISVHSSLSVTEDSSS